MKKIFQQFAKRWELHEDIVEIIYHLIDENGVKYGKTSKILSKLKVEICPRQLRYFYKKVKLEYNFKDKHPKNYSQLLRKC